MLVLYEASRNAPIRAAELSLAADGSVAIRVLVESTVTSELSAGVLSSKLRRNVLPEEGETFLEALRESLARSSYWYLEDEPVK